MSKLLDAGMPGHTDRPRRRASTSPRRSFRQHVLKASWAALSLFALAVGLAHATATYVYDANGRLRAVTNSTGASAEYVYDAMGNLLQVQSVPANQLAIFAFTPNHGSTGTTVTISGQGFSATVANDTVAFNGTVATVTAATSTTLTTSVPAGATTGAITVSVGTSTATSSDLFTVDATGQPPVVTSFSPSIGGAGTAVTVIGQNLDPVSNQSYPAINGTKANPTSASQTQVVFPVGAGMGSGKVSVTTLFGMGASSADFFVTPPGINAANVAVTTRVAVGASVPLSIPAGKYAAVLFDASAGSYLSFQANNIVSSSSVNYTVYDSHNQLIASGVLSTTDASIHLPQAPITGTYAIWLTSTSAANLTLGLEADPTLALSTVLTTSTTGPGQSQRLFFNAAVNQTLGLVIASQATSPSGASVQYTVAAPNGAQVASITTAAATFFNLPNLPASSTYTIVVAPNASAAVTSQLELVSGVTGNGNVNGASLNATTQWGGQGAYLTFTATAGENIGLGISNLSESPDNAILVNVYAPSGANVASTWCYVNNGGCGLDLQNLAAGTYQVQITPNSNNDTMSFTATVSDDATGTLPLNTVQSVGLARRGQTATYTFSASAGQSLALEASGVATVPSSNIVSYVLYTPDGKQYTTGGSRGEEFIDLTNLPQSGTYKVYLQPSSGATLSESLELESGITLAVNGPAQNFTSRTSGQYAFMTFTATAGENVGIGINNLSESPDNVVMVYAYAPNGAYVSGGACYVNDGGCGLDLQNLVAGLYQIQVVPDGSGDTMSFAATAMDDAKGTLPLNTPVSVSLAQRGQTGTYTFSASAGQTLALEASSVATVPSGNIMSYVLYTPDGNQYKTGNGKGDVLLDLAGLPQSGTYKLYVQPNVGATLSESLVLESGAALTVNGPSQNFTSSVPGQQAFMIFTATTGENVSLGISSLSESPDNAILVNVYAPGGANVAGAWCYIGSSCVLSLQNLTSGAYQVQVTPNSNNDTMSFTAAVTQQ
ncbi:IPT/TIG domain-containing protein [Dyella agri]|uniref:IPT/TIG domain-containing protein n=1 Tax=Dyella agri TaxID=1926869 RepID=A0ABW8KI68_9GAMM